MTTCKNCLKNFESNFCNFCGQKKIKTRITLKELFLGFLGAFLNYDSGFLPTITNLIVEPRKVILNYFEGKRKSYFDPVKLLIISVALNLFLIRLIDTNKSGLFMDFFLSDYWMFMQVFYYIPIYGLLSFLFFKKYGFTYSEHLVLNIYMYSIQSFLSTVFYIMVLLFPIVFKGYDYSLIVGFIVLIWFYTQTFNRNRIRAVGKGIFIYISAHAIVYLPMVIIYNVFIKS